MDSKKFKDTWRKLAVGTGLASLVFVVLGSVMDKNPVMTAMVGLSGFAIVNALFLIVSFLTDPPKQR